MMSTAERVVALVHPVVGSDLPVRIRAWDGSEAGPLNAPVVHLRFEVREVQSMREHYVRTVADWHDTFEKQYRDAKSMMGEEVARVWRLYLVGGGLAFEQGRMGVDQILAIRPALKGDPVCPVPDWHEV